MSERTVAALAKLDQLLAVLDTLPRDDHHGKLIDDAQALRRAVAAFHMEAIRFRIYSVDRAITALGNPPDARHLVDEVRQELESAGFHTRSHTAP